jgi:hypothetical protein
MEHASLRNSVPDLGHLDDGQRRQRAFLVFFAIRMIALRERFAKTARLVKSRSIRRQS